MYPRRLLELRGLDAVGATTESESNERSGYHEESAERVFSSTSSAASVRAASPTNDVERSVSPAGAYSGAAAESCATVFGARPPALSTMRAPASSGGPSSERCWVRTPRASVGMGATPMSSRALRTGGDDDGVDCFVPGGRRDGREVAAPPVRERDDVDHGRPWTGRGIGPVPPGAVGRGLDERPVVDVGGTSKAQSRAPGSKQVCRTLPRSATAGVEARPVPANAHGDRNGYDAPPDRTGMADWIRETFTSDAGWGHLETLVDLGNRMAGHPGEREGLEATRDALESVGARDARVETFDLQGWVRGESEIRTPETAEECIALPRSPAGEVEAELVDLGAALPEDFESTDVEGKVVLASSMVPDYFDRYIHRTEKYQYAVEGGAVAFVYANHVPGQLPPTGSVGGSDGGPIGDIPAVGVSKETGARLGRRFDGDEVAVSVDCETPDAESGNVVAELGPDTEEYVVLSCHVDAHDVAEGARDNGAGTATMVEVARALAMREDDLDTCVKCIGFGAEEVGLVGAEWEAERADLEAVKAVVNVDSNVGGRTLRLTTHRFPELEAAADRVADRMDHPISTVPRMVPHSDHWPFVRWGVPGYMVSSESEERGRGWGHTSADTLDKLEARTLREQAILLTELVVEVADDGVTVAHEEPSVIAGYLEAEDQAEGMKKTGDWPY